VPFSQQHSSLCQSDLNHTPLTQSHHLQYLDHLHPRKEAKFLVQALQDHQVEIQVYHQGIEVDPCLIKETPRLQHQLELRLPKLPIAEKRRQVEHPTIQKLLSYLGMCGKTPHSGKKKTSGTFYDPKAPLVSWHVRNSCGPKTCNGWNWEGEGKIQKVHLNNEDPPINRICYNSMVHIEGDVVKPKDCIVLASGHRKRDLPFIAKVTSLWENPEDGEMCMSLLWYYRPEHVDSGRKSDDLQDEIFASKHRDFTSVACIEDKCYVMTFNEYCRYRKFQRMVDQGITPGYSIVPELMEGYDRADLLPRCMVAPDRVFLCRRVYDPRQKRIFKLGKQPLY